MRISLPALPFLKPASIPFLPLLGLKMRKHSMDKRHVLPALQRFKPSWLHLNKRCGSQARFRACRDTAFETKRLPTASAHEFACCISHRFLIFDANDCIENCVTRGLVRNSHSTWCWQEKESNSKHRIKNHLPRPEWHYRSGQRARKRGEVKPPICQTSTGNRASSNNPIKAYSEASAILGAGEKALHLASIASLYRRHWRHVAWAASKI